MKKAQYNRDAALAYAAKWAFGRNPAYSDFSKWGGDCTNFISQCIYAGAGVMNFTRDTGWYYRSLNDRAAAWSGVEYLHRFLTRNKGAGPVAVHSSPRELMPGDIIQLCFKGSVFSHSLLLLSKGTPPEPENMLIATHTYDAYNRPLASYEYKQARYLHITHVNKPLFS